MEGPDLAFLSRGDDGGLFSSWRDMPGIIPR